MQLNYKEIFKTIKQTEITQIKELLQQGIKIEKESEELRINFKPNSKEKMNQEGRVAFDRGNVFGLERALKILQKTILN